MNSELEKLLASPPDVQTPAIGPLRDMRQHLNAAESDISLVRRLTQGRLDIVGHEVARREAVACGETPPGEVSGLLFDMPDILGDSTQPGRRQEDKAAQPSSGTPQRYLSQMQEPGSIARDATALLDTIVSSGDLANISEFKAEEITEVLDRLRLHEVELSKARRTLHDYIDLIQQEVARRYREGEVTVQSALEQGLD